jgi:hypothetical protein
MTLPHSSLLGNGRPKALCELHGHVYNAWLRMAEVFDVLGTRAQRT